ncbi:MAG: hypothetical protein PHR15_06650 [Atopobiaceae bacterium]|nr:hypothetical protein [Atopobiaceae bacterium]MCH4214955.1 hypothetical protein [Atopobiaceae bacterium]MCH4230686.1 hypothetical protein [Atopobiaceae bacterium]MCH4277106.1 hypothetical protein [Atopobiaceae bacterium]MCI1227263.1 hypothetical protein [Atopobiaceae bacterium]
MSLPSHQVRPLSVMAVAMMVSVTLLCLPSGARADEASDLSAQESSNSSQIAEQQAKATQLADESDQLSAQMQDLEAKATDTANKLQEAQQHVSDLVSYQYKTSNDADLLSILTSSSTFDELISRVTYYSKVTDSLTDAVDEVKAEQADLDSQKQQLTDLYTQNQQNRDEATQLVSQLTSENAQIDSRLSDIAAQQVAQQTAEEQAQQAAAQVQSDSSADAAEPAGDSGSTSAGSTDEGGSSSGGTSDGGGSSSGGQTDSSWSTGLASGYDPDEAGTSTATGIPFDWTTRTVAIPMRWSNFSSYFYRYVEISYGGTTITAQVTDCGGLPGRALDLSPACQRAFGASSSDDWGVRTVSYRFL